MLAALTSYTDSTKTFYFSADYLADFLHKDNPNFLIYYIKQKGQVV
jgi:hypothetical protein